jgi:hypothetical protein
VGTIGICLWLEDDDNYSDWLRLPALDAHLYFEGGPGPLLTVDIEGLIEHGVVRRVDGASGLIHASFAHDVISVGERGNLEAAWFWRSGIVAPPTNVSSLRDALTSGQRSLYDRVAASVRRSRSGVILLLWEDASSINALGVRLDRATPGHYTSTALEVARTDQSVLRLRSGPDGSALAGRTVAVFGIGAIGSEITLLLARSGVGCLILVDRERLRPANLSRHAASGRRVGKHKADAMAATIRETFPDVRIVTSNELLWRPAQIEETVRASDLVIDATGNRAYGDLLSRSAAEAITPIVSAALHRAGSIARVRAQVGSGHALWARSPEDGFPEIPAALGAPPPPTWETGCGSPVNNAPPVSVTGAATLASRVVIDILTGRNRREREVFEVYEPIETSPFDQRGLLTFESAS